jgi:hypothetical protein
LQLNSWQQSVGSVQLAPGPPQHPPSSQRNISLHAEPPQHARPSAPQSGPVSLAESIASEWTPESLFTSPVAHPATRTMSQSSVARRTVENFSCMDARSLADRTERCNRRVHDR